MKYLILGAGPAGLSFANRLLENGEDSFLVLEKEKKAGGLCRSEDVDGAPLDIGGGHFLDVRRPKVNEFLFQFMPEDEWSLFQRDSRIVIGDSVIGHPFEANIWQMNSEKQKIYLQSIAEAGCNTGKPLPEKFIDWIRWKLGDKISEDYMIPYNMKMFGDNLNELGTYWLEKLPNVSYEETKLSCQHKKPYGQQPGHAQFYYPKKYGYGELWDRMAQRLGNRIEFSKKVDSIDFLTRTIKTEEGALYCADTIVTTVPWKEFRELKGMPDELKNSVVHLKHSSVEVEYYSQRLDTEAHWLYYPDLNLPYHRILVRHNFCIGSEGYWTETNGNRATTEMNQAEFRYLNEYAYPLNTQDKPFIMKNILAFSKENNVYGLGRWGEHQHYNSDLTVELALKLADEMQN